MDDYWLAVVWTLLPTVVVSAMFYFVMRSVIRADRNERREYARLEARERARRGLPPVPAGSPDAATAPGAITAPTGP
jgi:heme exporter protein D